MHVLVVGSGGREHALATAIAAAGHRVDAAPGNPGIAAVAACHPVRVDDVAGLTELAGALRPDLVVIGPEAPLVAGLADRLRQGGIPVFGPNADAAALEGSKAFAKEVMVAAGVPTAAAHVATTVAEARAAVAALGGRVVVKADGLAAGKGVIVCDDAADAERAVDELRATTAGATLVIEERLDGPEASLLAICSGTTIAYLPAARDHKRIGDGDTGPNTGGMGAFAPIPDLADGECQAIVDRVHRPVLEELARRGTRFCGCLYAGLILTADGPRVLEFNVRFGDPETQALVPLVDADLAAWLLAGATADLEEGPVPVRPGAAVTVVLASRGYPATSDSGRSIHGIDAARATGAEVFHAGTALRAGELVTAGGRVLAVTGRGPDLQAARALAYAGADAITFDGMQRRADIAAADATLQAT